MIFNKVILFVLLFALSCKKQQPKKVFYFDDESITILNGNVKQVLVSNSNNFYQLYFDKKGDLEYSQKRVLYIWQDSVGSHSETDDYEVKYLSLYKQGNKTGVVGTRIGDNNKTKWELDSTGRVVNYTESMTDSSYCKGIYKYNNESDLIDYKRNYCTAREPTSYKYKNDSNHNVEESLFYEGDVFLIKTIFKYQSFDSNNNWTKCITYIRRYPPMQASYRTDTITRKITYY